MPGPSKVEGRKTGLCWLWIHSLKNNRQGGEDAMRERGNFKRHCLETRNKEKTTSMLYDYPRTGLARRTSLHKPSPRHLKDNQTKLY